MAGIEVHQVTEDRPDLLEALVAVRAVTDREVNPDDPPAPAEEVAAELFSEWAMVRHVGFVALVEGSPAGELGLAAEKTEENAHMVDVEWLAVDPAHRRRGVADALLRTGLGWAEDHGRSAAVLWAPTLPGGAGRAYAERCGATLRLEERCSRLPIDELDQVRQEGVAAGRAGPHRRLPHRAVGRPDARGAPRGTRRCPPRHGGHADRRARLDGAPDDARAAAVP